MGLKKYYQPNISVFPDDLASFEVYLSLENGMEDYPEIPRELWDEYSGDDIEEPTFVDFIPTVEE